MGKWWGTQEDTYVTVLTSFSSNDLWLSCGAIEKYWRAFYRANKAHK